jgi:hypothetical protein
MSLQFNDYVVLLARKVLLFGLLLLLLRFIIINLQNDVFRLAAIISVTQLATYTHNRQGNKRINYN